FLSLEDDLMRLFSSERIIKLMDRMGVEEGEVLTHNLITKSIERAQKRVEARNFGIRKHLLEYDDVMNNQREIIYDRRNYALHGQDILPEIEKMVAELTDSVLQDGAVFDDGMFNVEALRHELGSIYLLDFPEEGLTGNEPDELKVGINDQILEHYRLKRSLAEPEAFSNFERYVSVRIIDEKWQQHLYSMDQVREGINLRAYGQKNPLLEYKSEAFSMFVEMLDDINRATLNRLFRVRIAGLEDQHIRLQRVGRQLQTTHAEAANMGFAAQQAQQQGDSNGAQSNVPAGIQVPPAQRKPIRVAEKVGRNDPCPCGSGKKYKKCHGR
ncbi:MAG: SEC-C metal-binding domain-containing protein, partial [Candidatus Neomarinimicrobiota bacterium]